MDRIFNKSLVDCASKLRRNMTKEERHLWYDFLRNYELKFIRQKIFGKYILDFYCAQIKLAIELDGSQHYDEEAERHDLERTKYLSEYGVKVIRISNLEINTNFKGVCVYIDNVVKNML